MNIVWGFLLVPFIVVCLIPFLRMKGKAVAVYCAISIVAILTSIVAFQGLAGQNFEVTLPGSLISGPIRIQVDALSAWFMLIINFSFITGGCYGLFYMGA